MVCTYCGSSTRITNSRHQRRTNSTWRRRTCRQCARTVTTIEQLDYERSWRVHYTNGTSRPFLRDKLLLSVHQSLGHRPTALPDALGLTHTLVGKLTGIVDNGALTSLAVATATHQTLQRFDKAAATVYRAYHADVLDD